MEQACLRLVARHMTSQEIAAELGIAKTSVDTYCNRARAKLGVADRFEAARRLVSDQDPAERYFRPLPSIAPAAPAPAALAAAMPAATGAKARHSAWLMGSLAMLLAAGLAIATLLSGLRALDAMRPLPQPPHHHST